MWNRPSHAAAAPAHAAARRVFADRAVIGASDPVIAAWVARATAEAEQITS